MRRRGVLALLGLLPLVASVRGRALAQYLLPPLQEAPALAERVAAGALPPVAQRLPRNPAIAAFDRPGQAIGRYGGSIVTLMARAQDVRLMFVYGYARLIRFDHRFDLVPDILESVEVEAGRIFTLRLREGHRWSDGHPFTAEDFRYFWEDVANDSDLRPTGPPEELRVRGRLPAFAVLDDRTVRYAWEEPNPTFLAALAGAAPLLLYRPAHYLRRFHRRHADPATLDAMAKAEGVPFWAALHNKRDNQYRFDNPELPTLQPWMGITTGPSERFLFDRNPYFHRVDPEGRQLPYVDRWVLQIADGKIIPAMTGTGQSTLQARYLRFDNFAFLRQNAARAKYHVHGWRIARGAHLALFPNLNAADPVWRTLLRDVRFRRALSLAIHRRELNRVLYFGQAVESQNTVLAGSPLYRSEYQTAYAAYTPAEASRLLDEIGLTRRDSRGVRLLPDGRPLVIVIETAGESTEESDALQLVHDSWLDVGVKLITKPSHRDVLRNRIFAGETLMSISSGLENGLPTADQSPQDLAPTSQVQYQWPKWGQHFETGGQVGEAPDLPGAAQLLALLDAWRRAPDKAARVGIWHEMLAIHAEELFSIGLVTGVLQPVVVADTLRNVPTEGVYNWDPGAHFGIYETETFWLDEKPDAAGNASR